MNGREDSRAGPKVLTKQLALVTNGHYEIAHISTNNKRRTP
jgi:hypothetical protein